MPEICSNEEVIPSVSHHTFHLQFTPLLFLYKNMILLSPSLPRLSESKSEPLPSSTAHGGRATCFQVKVPCEMHSLTRATLLM